MASDLPTAPHPGARLREELERRGWNQSDLIFVLGCHPKTVNQIITGKQGISPAMSKALGDALGISPDLFADLQKAHDLALANEPDPAVALRARMQDRYPIREMIRREWLRGDGSQSLGEQLAKFFDVSEPNEVPYLEHAAKKTAYDEKRIPPSQLAWLFRVKQLARAIVVAPFSERKLRECLEKLSALRIDPAETRHVPRLLSECGVRFVIVEALPGSKIDGVCFWLDDKSPVIGMSMRFDRIDNFWFVLRHEIEHVLRGDGRRRPEGMMDAELQAHNGEDCLPEEERAANAAASDFCVPAEKMQSFLLRKHPFFYEKDVVAFAKVNGLHPGLAVGQIQRCLGRYDYLKKHQAKIRQYVLPGAIVDGWGQTMPLT